MTVGKMHGEGGKAATEIAGTVGLGGGARLGLSREACLGSTISLTSGACLGTIIPEGERIWDEEGRGKQRR